MMGIESIGNFEEVFEKEMRERKVREREEVYGLFVFPLPVRKLVKFSTPEIPAAVPPICEIPPR